MAGSPIRRVTVKNDPESIGKETESLSKQGFVVIQQVSVGNDSVELIAKASQPPERNHVQFVD